MCLGTDQAGLMLHEQGLHLPIVGHHVGALRGTLADEAMQERPRRFDMGKVAAVGGRVCGDTMHEAQAIATAGTIAKQGCQRILLRLGGEACHNEPPHWS